ncbi:MAG TPA: alpha/beta hydrolase, partial [Myxococcaceae bacterium]|nr:alpha/beta hydrolase [Myxococcaceae bacterium]
MSELLDRFSSPDSFLELPSGRVATWRFGSGPDLIAIHGWPLHAATWRTVLPRLSQHYTVHLLDLPGSGLTDWPGAVDLEICAQVVRELVDRLGTRRYGLLAHDSGGAIARLAGAGDERLAALVLGNTEIPGHHPPLLLAYVVAARLGLAGVLLKTILGGPLRTTNLGVGSLFTDPAYAGGEFGELFLGPLADRRVRESQLRMLRSVDFDLVDALAEVHRRIHAPTLCIWGPDDPFFPVAKARAMLPQFAGTAELVEIP